MPRNTQSNPKPSSSRSYRPPQTRNKKVNFVFTRSGRSYDPPPNLNQTTTIIHDDSEDEAEEEPKENEQNSTPVVQPTPPLKAYKPRIPYPQRLRKEKMEEQYGKFIDLIKEVRIDVPLVDVLAGMRNYGRTLCETFIRYVETNKNEYSFSKSYYPISGWSR